MRSGAFSNSRTNAKLVNKRLAIIMRPDKRDIKDFSLNHATLTFFDISFKKFRDSYLCAIMKV